MAYKRIGFAVLGAVMALGMASAAFAQGAKPEFTICSGGNTGGYYKDADRLAKAVSAYVTLKNSESAGTVANLERLGGIRQAEGKCDFLIFQDDSRIAVKDDLPGIESKYVKVRGMYPEFGQLFTKKGSGLDSIDDFVGKGKKIAVKAGSGALVTLKAMGKLESDYQVGPKGLTLEIIPEDGSWEDAFDKLVDGDVGGVFYVGGLTSELITNYAGAASRKLMLAEVKDGDLDDDGVYQNGLWVDKKVYPTLGGNYVIATEATLAMSRETEDKLKALNLLRPVQRAMSDEIQNIRATKKLDLVSGLK